MEVQCSLCEHFVEYEYFDEHYKKCLTIKYMQDKMKQLYNKDIRYSDLYYLSDEEFNKKYIWLINRVYETTSDEREKKRLENILYGTDYSLKECF